MTTTRDLLDRLLAARDACAAERVAPLLRDDVRYWDPERGEVSGRDAVAAALVGHGGALELETVAAGEADAVIELGVRGASRRTEVYRLADGGVQAVRAYFDPS
jgi:hypothetical protein